MSVCTSPVLLICKWSLFLFNFQNWTLYNHYTIHKCIWHVSKRSENKCLHFHLTRKCIYVLSRIDCSSFCVRKSCFQDFLQKVICLTSRSQAIYRFGFGKPRQVNGQFCCNMLTEFLGWCVTVKHSSRWFWILEAAVSGALESASSSEVAARAVARCPDLKSASTSSRPGPPGQEARGRSGQSGSLVPHREEHGLRGTPGPAGLPPASRPRAHPPGGAGPPAGCSQLPRAQAGAAGSIAAAEAQAPGRVPAEPGLSRSEVLLDLVSKPRCPQPASHRGGCGRGPGNAAPGRGPQGEGSPRWAPCGSETAHGLALVSFLGHFGFS